MSGRYNSGRVARMRGQIDLVGHEICAALLDTSLYTADLVGDLSLEDLPDNSILATAVLSGKYIDETTCTFFADDAVFTNVPVDEEGRQVSAVVLYKNVQEIDECTLISLHDDLDGLPIEPDGTDIIIHWPALGILIG